MTTDTIKRCKNFTCRVVLDEWNTSIDDPDYCEVDGDLVIAFCPQPDHFTGSAEERASKGDEFFRIPIDDDTKGAVIEFSADQCGTCGSSQYTYQRNEKGRWVVKCSPDPIYDGIERAGDECYDAEGHFLGCGTEFSVHVMAGRRVNW